jgi:hypothetical protein
LVASCDRDDRHSRYFGKTCLNFFKEPVHVDR